MDGSCMLAFRSHALDYASYSVEPGMYIHTCIQCKLQPYHASITVTCGTCIFLIVQATYICGDMHVHQFHSRVYTTSYTSLQYKKSGGGEGMHINQKELKI